MNMSGYTKLFSSILASTIWQESKETKIIWITMLAASNQYGVVEASIPGLAHMAMLTIGEAEAALEVLMSPDPYSRTPAFEGRRIKATAGGWQILNHDKYREQMSAAERKEYNRIKQKESRDRRKARGQEDVKTEPRESMTVNDSSASQRHTEAKEDSKAESEETHTPAVPTGEFDLKMEPSSEPKKAETDPAKLRLFNFFNRRLSRRLDVKEEAAFRKARIETEDLDLVEQWWMDQHREWEGENYRPRTMITLLNGWSAAVDKADDWKAFPPPPPKAAPIFTKGI